MLFFKIFRHCSRPGNLCHVTKHTRLYVTNTKLPSSLYMQYVANGFLKEDNEQLNAMKCLDRLQIELETYRPVELDQYDAFVINRLQTDKYERLHKQHLEKVKEREEMLKHIGPHREHHVFDPLPHFDTSTLDALKNEAKILKKLPEAPQGVYLWGDVGTGKSYIMDLFYENAPVDSNKKLRIHFHTFVRDVLQMFHRLRSSCPPELRDKYDHNFTQLIARSIASQAYLICFDEIQVPDVATASFLYQVIKQMMDYRVILVSTSNRTPQDLYQGHFKEELFDPFVQLLCERSEIHHLQGNDYRELLLRGTGQPGFSESYFVGPSAQLQFEAAWQFVTEHQTPCATSVHVFGRTVAIPRATRQGVARFDFKELCATPLGPADYLAIAQRFHTIFLENIPKMSMSLRNEARRLISLVDALYECRCKLICTAEVHPEALFNEVDDPEHDRFEIMHGEMMGQMLYDLKRDGGDVYKNVLFSGKEELFASQRCISRLLEMRSTSYLSQQHQPDYGSSGLDFSHLQLSDNQTHFPGTFKPSVESSGRKKVKLRDRHFWGFGWWEKVTKRGNVDA